MLSDEPEDTVGTRTEILIIVDIIKTLIIKITISSIVIGLKNSYFPLIHLPSCYNNNNNSNSNSNNNNNNNNNFIIVSQKECRSSPY